MRLADAELHRQVRRRVQGLRRRQEGAETRRRRRARLTGPTKMIQPAATDLVTVNIDGREIAVPRGTNVIEAARRANVDVPFYCYHPKLTVVGNCRMCLVEMGMPAVDPATKTPVMDPATGRQKINWMPRPTIACATNASPGLQIRTTTPLVRECREGVM